MTDSTGDSVRQGQAPAFQNTLSAFQSFVELVKDLRAYDGTDEKILLPYLQPFLSNPGRDSPYVKEILAAYASVWAMRLLGKLFPIKVFMRIIGNRTIGTDSPEFIARLRTLAQGMHLHLKPGNVLLNIRPVRFIEQVSGYGMAEPKRYRVQIEPLVDTVEDDLLQSFTLKLTVGPAGRGLEIDNISPESAFSGISKKIGSASQVGLKKVDLSEVGLGGEANAAGQKLTALSKTTNSLEISSTESGSVEETLSRVEQYRTARKIGALALWETTAGVGPVDVEAGEYTAYILVPKVEETLELTVEARAVWLYAGVMTARASTVDTLPNPESTTITIE